MIAEKEYDAQFAEDTVSFFWSEVRKSLSELSSTSITIRKLGIFLVKHWKIEESVNIYKKHLEKNEALTFKQAALKKRMEQHYEKLTVIQDKFTQEGNRKIKNAEKRKKYESAKTMGEQIQDNGGASEQRNQEG